MLNMWHYEIIVSKYHLEVKITSRTSVVAYKKSWIQDKSSENKLHYAKITSKMMLQILFPLVIKSSR